MNLTKFFDFIKLIFIYKNVKIKRLPHEWITLKEYKSYMKVISCIFRCNNLKDDFILFAERIITLVNKSGSTFTFSYLKECFRIITRKLARVPIVPSKKIFIRLDNCGLPRILPIGMRDAIVSFNVAPHKDKNNLVTAILTAVSIFRVMPTKVLPSLDTITSNFTGRYFYLRSSLLEKVVNKLNIKHIPFVLKKPSILMGNKSSPNSYKSGLASVLDAFAFLHEPKLYWALIKFNGTRGIWVSILLTYILINLGWIYIISLYLGFKKSEMGSLSVVYDQAGKARVVAITNWWVQISLKPLHDHLFKLLSNIPYDGTFDQLAPFDLILNNVNSVMQLNKGNLNNKSSLDQESIESNISKDITLHGFDLSAATDRLPLTLQIQILNILSEGLGDKWRDLLDISWLFDKLHYKYTVGQPMGAYSSWGMLAFTHHCIVQYAYKLVYPKSKAIFKDYAILGDDVMIKNKLVANSYLKIMTDLGLEISSQKSIISDIFSEFAKKLKGYNGIDISPIGPKLILGSLRYEYQLINLFVELMQRGLVHMNTFFWGFMWIP